MVASKHQRLSKKIMTNISHLFHGHALAGWVLSVFHPFFGKASSQNLPQTHWTHIHNKSTTCIIINLEKGWQNGIKKSGLTIKQKAQDKNIDCILLYFRKYLATFPYPCARFRCRRVIFVKHTPKSRMLPAMYTEHELKENVGNIQAENHDQHRCCLAGFPSSMLWVFIFQFDINFGGN